MAKEKKLTPKNKVNNSKSRFAIEDRAKIEDKYILYVEDVKVSFKKKGKKTEVLKGVDFQVRQGETVAVVGANGAGKTVLMETILGVIQKDSGEIYLNLGHKTFQDNLIEVGIQYQQAFFPKKSTVRKLLKQYKSLYGGNRISKEQFNEMIDVFGIKDYYDMKINKLSGGQKQRLNLMLSIMHNPKLMILDEFITGLDIKSVKNIISYVNKLKINNNASMIIISHQPEEVEELADRVIVLTEGVMSESFTPNEINEKWGSIANFIEENI